jgi:NodT family efflux transporter outer membrane factor (OMF) lipoprotein
METTKSRIKEMKYVMFTLLLSAALVYSCSIPKDLQTANTIVTPAGFRMDSLADTTYQKVKWNTYFKDSYLLGLIDTAILFNMDLQAANQRIYAARTNLTASKNAMLPQVNAAVSTGVTRFGDYTIDGVGNFDTNKSLNINEKQKIPNPVPDYWAGLNTSWEVGFTGKLQHRKRAQYNKLLASEYGKQYLTTQLVAEVAKLYYELLTLDTELEIIKRNILLQERANEIITIQKESGRINELAVKQFQAQVLKSKSLEFMKLQEITETENALNTILGRYPQKIYRKDTIDIGDIPAMLKAGVPSDLLRNRPDVQQSEKEYVASTYQFKSAKAMFYPSINIQSNIGVNAFKSSLWFDYPASLAYGLLGGISAPLLNRNQVMANYRNAYAEKNESFIKYQKSVLTGVEEVSTEMNRMKNYQRVSELKTAEVETLRQAVTISNELFLTGYANYVEVLIVRQNSLESELQLAEAHKQQFFSSIFLYKALGGGWN